MSIFTAIGDFLNATSWFPLITWTFWTLLVILAISGVYTARFGKRKLLTLGFQGVLKLVIIYMVATAGYVWAPSFMARFSQLPFLSVSEETLTLVNPLALLDRWNTVLPRVVVRLYFLLFFINAVSVFDYNPPNFLSWFFFQFISGTIAVVIYAALSSMFIRFWPGSIDLLYNITALLILVSFCVILALKFFFTFIAKGGNATFQTVYMFLTSQKFGLQFTVSALSFLIVVVYLVIADFAGHNRLVLGSFNTVAFCLNGVMCTLTLYAFSRYYNG